jgi:type I restriction enzyme, S subunit
MKWQSGRLIDYIELKYGKGLPERSRVLGDIPVYGSGGTIGVHNNALVKGPGIVVGRKGTVGSVFWVSQDFFPIDTTYYVLPKNKNVDLRFTFYLLRSLPLKKMNTDAAVPGLNRDNAYRLDVAFPDPETQERIVSFLSAYDDLIENNQRRIALLEKAARQLYKEWFVRFQFPGHEHLKVIDGVPEGWAHKRLIDIADLVMGQSPKSEFYNTDGEGLPFHQGVTNFGIRFVEHETYCTMPTRLSKAGDILFSVRAPVGRLNITLDKIVLGRGVSAIRSKEGRQSFLFYQLKSYFFKEDMIGGGAIYASVTKKNLENQNLLVPSKLLLEEFDEFSSQIDEQIKTLHIANKNLTEARDILLPKLMNGEITV